MADDRVDPYWVEKATTAPVDSLANVRAAAKDWGATFTAITSVFTGISVLTLPKDITKLGDKDLTSVIVALAIAVIASALAIDLAGIASQGWGKIDWVSGRALYNTTISQLEWSSKMLGLSTILAIPAVIAFAFAVYITATEQETPKTESVSAIVVSGGEVSCVTLGPGEAAPVEASAETGVSLAVVPSCSK